VNKEFENVTRGLAFYLESKREYFARFYFLSNEEIIEILGQMREPRNVQKFLGKIFEGIDYLGFLPNGDINGLFSKEDEHLSLKNTI
jgi:dynein heavy chain